MVEIAAIPTSLVACSITKFESMEHFWALFKRRFNEISTPPQGIKELWERVCIVSSNFSEEDCMALYESMPWRIVVVLVARAIGQIIEVQRSRLNNVEYLYMVGDCKL